jgi:anti-sigma B factor antagonist
MLTQEEIGKVVVLTATTCLDGSSAADARNTLDALLAGGHHRIVIDLGPLDFIDSSGLGFLVTAFRRVKEVGGRFCLCGVGPRIQTILDVTRLAEVLPVRNNRSSAIDHVMSQDSQGP